MNGGYLIINCLGHGGHIKNIYERINSTNKPVLLENWNDNIKSVLVTFRKDDDDGFLRAWADFSNITYFFTVKSDNTLTITSLPKT